MDGGGRRVSAGACEEPPEARSPRLRPVVYVLCGVPFAGKSTLARAMSARLAAVHLEVDAVVRDLGLGGEGGHPTRGEWVAAYREAQRRLDRLLADGRSVVYDATNFRRLMRARVRAIAAARVAAAVTVLVGPPPAEIAARREQNRREPTRPDVPEAAFREVAAGFQPPAPDEDAVAYDGTEPIEAWIERVLRGQASPNANGCK